MTNTCEDHQREKVIYDLELHQTICERCALFDPAHKGHSFLEVSQLAYHNQSLYESFIERLHSLHIQEENSGITCKQIRENVAQKIKNEVAIMNYTYDQMVKKIQKERQKKIEQIERKIKGLAEESKKSMKTLIQEQYFALVAQQQTLKQLVSQNKNIELCKALSSSNLTQKITNVEKELLIIKLQLKNKLAFASHEAPLQLPLPLSGQKSDKEENLMNDIDNQFVNMFDSLRYSRVSEKSNCKTEISFCSFPTTSDTKQLSLKNSNISIQSSLHTLKVHSKPDIKKLYIKNSIKQINMIQLDLSNRQAMEVIRKCTNNTFVSKLDMSDNQLTHKFITQLKKEKGLSKYLKKIVAKGMRIDIRQLKKEGINITTASNGVNIAIVGDITIEF